MPNIQFYFKKIIKKSNKQILKRDSLSSTINDLFVRIFHQDIQYPNYFIIFVMQIYMLSIFLQNNKLIIYSC